jgi:phosphoribosylanthranilate isomerase
LAIERVKPYAVDVSSGVETEGVKDFDKMKEFVKRVREYGKNII